MGEAYDIHQLKVSFFVSTLDPQSNFSHLGVNFIKPGFQVFPPSSTNSISATDRDFAIFSL
jgi:hypothetical protein